MKVIIEIDDEYAKYYDVENLYAEIYAYGDVRPKETFVSLKPLPKKLKLRIQDQWITDYDRYEIGYNACLDEIIGETE